MSAEPKEPYFSKRIRISDITSPKDLVGFKEFTVELILGNQDTRKIIKNKDDLADIEERDLFDELDILFNKRDEWAKKKGFKFVDQLEAKS